MAILILYSIKHPRKLAGVIPLWYCLFHTNSWPCNSEKGFEHSTRHLYVDGDSLFSWGFSCKASSSRIELRSAFKLAFAMAFGLTFAMVFRLIFATALD